MSRMLLYLAPVSISSIRTNSPTLLILKQSQTKTFPPFRSIVMVSQAVSTNFVVFDIYQHRFAVI